MNPTDAELPILKTIWRLGPSSVRQVLKALNEDRAVPAGYTTVLKLMQIMTEKGLLVRDASVRPQVYRAARDEKKTRTALVRDLLARAFDGSHRALVLQALSDKKATPKELAEIEALLDRLEDRS
jgi:predicted transcriptional regulator